MKPMTLFLLDPPPGDVEAGLSEGRVAAVFTSAEKRQAVCGGFEGKVNSGELIALGAEKLRPFARECRTATADAEVQGALVDAALAFFGVPTTVVITSEALFRVVTDALRREPRLPRALRFKGWPDGRRQDLLNLGFGNVAAIGAPPGGTSVGGGVSVGDIDARTSRAGAAYPFEGCTFHAWR